MGVKDCGGLAWLIEESELPEGARVLAVGPGVYDFASGPQPPMDIGLLTLLSHPHTKSVTVLDLPPDCSEGGMHNCLQVKDYLDMLREKGAGFAPYSFIQGDIFDERNPIGAFDAIHDHMTWFWAYPQGKEKRMLLSATGDDVRFDLLAKRYHGLLSPGGKAFLYNTFDATDEKTTKILSALERQGFSTEMHSGLEDCYPLSDPVLTADLTQDSICDNVFLKKLPGRYNILKDGLARPFHSASSLIVARR